MSDFIWVGGKWMRGPMVMERIAELEAENERIAKAAALISEDKEQAEAERDQMYQACADAGWEIESGEPEKFIAELAEMKAEAELAALKARRCETCAEGAVADRAVTPPEVYCGRHSSWWELGDSCNHWQERGK